MHLRIHADETIPNPTAIQTALQRGVSTKRHEFVANDSTDAFVVFEGEEEMPFWRREADGVRFVYTDLTYHNALATAKQSDSFLTHTTVDADGEEFLRYYREAWEKHRANTR